MKKRLLSAILCICLVVGLVPAAVFAAESTDVWDGSVATAFAGGEGTEENPYQIATAAQLAYFSELCSEKNAQAVTDKCWILTADIDLGGINWTPIGSLQTCYPTGWFDGNGHTVSGLSIKTEGSLPQNSSFGLFGVFEGKLTNLTVRGAMAFHNFADETDAYLSASFIGGICGLAAADIENCRSEVNFTVEAALNATFIGGIIGDFQAGVLQNSVFAGTIRATSNIQSGEKSIGGVTGGLYLGTVNSCKNEGDIISQYGHVGGVVGIARTGGKSGKAMVANCLNTGTVELARTGQLGGIVAYASAVNYNGELAEIQVVNCLNLGNITYSGTEEKDLKYVQVGPVYGLAGFTDTNPQAKVRLCNCYYVNEVSAGSAAVTQDENVLKKTADEVKTDEFMNLIANNENYKGSTGFWVQSYDGTIGLAFELADYTSVKEALARIPADLTVYSDATWKTLNDAVSAIQYGMLYKDQATVDGYAAAINAAVAALEYKEADYTAVDAAIAKAKALNKEDYKDFSAVEAAISAVVRGKNVMEQAEVDAMAEAIEAAIDSLEKKPAVPTTPNEGEKLPQTGDNHLVLWALLLLLSGSSLTCVTLYSKKRKYCK